MRSLTYFIIALIVFLCACKSDDDGATPFLTIESFQVTILENPEQGQLLGALSWQSDRTDVDFQLTNETTPGALEIDESGELLVLDASLFDFELNQVITSTVVATSGTLIDSANIAILLLNIEERTFYTGNPIVFSKANFADITLEVNQDRITDQVWLTRADIEGIFNIRSESDYNALSPAGTEWAKGSIAGVDTLSFSPWINAFESDPKSQIGESFVLHLIDEDIYIDFRLTSWTNGRDDGGGGGFSYERTTP